MQIKVFDVSTNSIIYSPQTICTFVMRHCCIVLEINIYIYIFKWDETENLHTIFKSFKYSKMPCRITFFLLQNFEQQNIQRIPKKKFIEWAIK